MKAEKFRELDLQEKEAVRHTIERIPKDGSKLPVFVFIHHPDDCLISYETLPGGFTVCILVAGREQIYRGVSRRSYKDRHNPIRGRMLALRRAVLYSSPVVIPGVISIRTDNRAGYPVLGIDGLKVELGLLPSSAEESQSTRLIEDQCDPEMGCGKMVTEELERWEAPDGSVLSVSSSSLRPNP